MSTPTVLLFSPIEHAHLVPYVAVLHASCITHDQATVTFLPPINHEKLLAWWNERIAEVEQGKRLVWILLDQQPMSLSGSQPKGSELVGVVMLGIPPSETGPFRGFVEKLLVSPRHRRRGGARALLGTLEFEAKGMGRTLLMIDTETGSLAESIFVQLGFVEVGKIPQYAISPSGDLKDNTFFYKRLV
ncbi:acyl-CoA N-acyltransferase [Xylariales sp. AK1849]|nr:acyl-CoA N-acyltransferase [Xylariales sp. AK1849]